MRLLFKVFPEIINSNNYLFLFYVVLYIITICFSFNIRQSLAQLNFDLQNQTLVRESKMLSFKYPYYYTKAKSSSDLIFRNLKYSDTKDAVQKHLYFIYYK